jgi:hypothetical protein
MAVSERRIIDAGCGPFRKLGVKKKEDYVVGAELFSLLLYHFLAILLTSTCILLSFLKFPL